MSFIVFLFNNVCYLMFVFVWYIFNKLVNKLVIDFGFLVYDDGVFVMKYVYFIVVYVYVKYKNLVNVYILVCLIVVDCKWYLVWLVVFIYVKNFKINGFFIILYFYYNNVV